MVVIMFTLRLPIGLFSPLDLYPCGDRLQRTRVAHKQPVPEVGRDIGPARRQAAQVARPWRSSLPGVSPLHLPSAKVSTPLTRIDR